MTATTQPATTITATARPTTAEVIRCTSTALHRALDADEPDRTRQALLALNVLDRDTAETVWDDLQDACRHRDNAIAWTDDPYNGEHWNDADLVNEDCFDSHGELDPVAAAEYAVEYWEQQVHQTVLEAARTVADHTILAHT